MLKPPESNERKQFFGSELRGAVGAPQDLHRKQNIGQNGSPRHEVCLLEHNAEIQMRLGDIVAVDLNGSTGGENQAADNLEERRFSAATRTQQRHQVSSLQIESNVLDHNKWGLPGAVKGLANVLEVPKRNES